MTHRLRALREERGLSLRQLANRSGVGFTIIGKIEKGEVKLASHHIARLAPALGCRPEDLVAERLLSAQEHALIKAVEGLPDDKIRLLVEVARAFRS